MQTPSLCPRRPQRQCCRTKCSSIRRNISFRGEKKDDTEEGTGKSKSKVGTRWVRKWLLIKISFHQNADNSLSRSMTSSPQSRRPSSSASEIVKTSPRVCWRPYISCQNIHKRNHCQHHHKSLQYDHLETLILIISSIFSWLRCRLIFSMLNGMLEKRKIIVILFFSWNYVNIFMIPHIWVVSWPGTDSSHLHLNKNRVLKSVKISTSALFSPKKIAQKTRKFVTFDFGQNSVNTI